MTLLKHVISFSNPHVAAGEWLYILMGLVFVHCSQQRRDHGVVQSLVWFLRPYWLILRQLMLCGRRDCDGASWLQSNSLHVFTGCRDQELQAIAHAVWLDLCSGLRFILHPRPCTRCQSSRPFDFAASVLGGHASPLSYCAVCVRRVHTHTWE